jgi:hypothetical protein
VAQVFLRYCFGSPLACCYVKPPCRGDDVVGDADDGGTCWRVSSRCCECYSVVDLREEKLDGGWWVPLDFHPVEVPVEFGLCDGPVCVM